MTRTARLRSLLYAFAVLAVLASPAFRDPPRDSFPLSNYPMFSSGRPDPHFTLTHALGVDADGTRVPLSPRVAAGSFEVLQAMRTIGYAVQEGRGEAFCVEVAGRVAEAGLPFEAVELATSRFDTLRYFDESPVPLERHVHHRCPVPATPREVAP